MRVTTELKNLIKRSFDEKRAKVTNELQAAAIVLYEDKKREVVNSKEFEAYVKACKDLYERFKEEYESQGSYCDSKAPFRFYLTNMNNIRIEDIIKSNVDYYSKYNEEIQTNISKEIKALDLAQESLMIKLAYEKDLDTVRAMLAEYDITI